MMIQRSLSNINGLENGVISCFKFLFFLKLNVFLLNVVRLIKEVT